MILGIVGKKYVGKTTVTNEICKNYDFVELAFASTLKKICKEIFSLSDEQLFDAEKKENVDTRWGKSPRELFQIVGTDLFRNHFDENIWIDVMKQKLKNIPPHKNIIFSDIRQQNELDFVEDLNRVEPVVIIEIIRPGLVENDTHITEKGNLKFFKKIIIVNDGNMESLKLKINDVMKKMNLKQKIKDE